MNIYIGIVKSQHFLGSSKVNLQQTSLCYVMSSWWAGASPRSRHRWLNHSMARVATPGCFSWMSGPIKRRSSENDSELAANRFRLTCAELEVAIPHLQPSTTSGPSAGPLKVSCPTGWMILEWVGPQHGIVHIRANKNQDCGEHKSYNHAHIVDSP